MDLLNQTPYCAELFRSAVADDRFLGMAVCKLTYKVGANGSVEMETEDPVPVSKGPTPTPFGDLPGDMVCRKEGVDILVLGQAHTPGGKPIPAMEVTLAVGEAKWRLGILGNRTWKKGLMGLAPTKPEPFTTMPITWENAFGGAALLQNKDVPHPDNLNGKGYILDKAEADGIPLPNIEDPDNPILSWDTRPRPLLFAPLPVATNFRAENTTKTDPNNGQVKVLPSFFNDAHPKFRLESLVGGEQVELIGMTPDAPLRFSLPSLPLEVEVTLAERSYLIPVKIDTLVLLPEERRFVVIYRGSFTYRYVPEEQRLAILRLAPTSPAGEWRC